MPMSSVGMKLMMGCGSNQPNIPSWTSFTVTPSVGNFLLVHFSEASGRTAAEADAHLTRSGVIVRRVSSYGLPHALRVTVGSEEANRAFVGALSAFLGGERA